MSNRRTEVQYANLRRGSRKSSRVDAVVVIAAATIALGTLNDRVNITVNDTNINHPDLISPIAQAVQTLSDRLGFDMEAFMNYVDDTLEPGAEFILTVDDDY